MSSIINAGTSGVTITGSTSTVLSLATNGTTRLNIDASGNLAVGTGNLTFSSTAQRITGDMSNATLASRLLFQNSVTNGNTNVAAIPNGTSTISAFRGYGASDPTNATAISIAQIGTTESRISSEIFGTASYVPMTFFTGGSERMRIDSSGNVGIGGTADASAKVNVLGTLPTSGTNTNVFWAAGTVPSGTTGDVNIFRSNPSTAAASFTVSSLTHFWANQGTIGAGSTVTNQYGFLAPAGLTGATNNYGFYSNIASGSNRWNFYAGGTARNYFAGNTGIGTVGGTTVRLWLVGSDATSSNFALYADNSASTTLFFVRNDGLFRTGSATFSPYNYTTGNAANLYVNADGDLQRSTSSLRYKSDVVDATHGLADVLKLRSVTYKGKNDSDTVFGGLIAEEVHDAGLTEFVAYDKEGRPDALHYGNMVALLAKAIQELSAKVAALEAK